MSGAGKKGSSQHCCVPMCNSDARYDPTIHFHHIPKDKGLKKQWIAKIRRDEGPLFKITASTVVCSKHFKTEDYKWTPIRMRLKNNSVPSVFNWVEETTQRRPLKRKILSSKKAFIDSCTHKEDEENKTTGAECQLSSSRGPTETQEENVIKKLRLELDK